MGSVLALGFVLYWAPKQKAEEARAEIDAWSTAWHKARVCLLGDAQQSSDPGQTLSVRALTTPGLHGKLGACMNALKPLRRGEGYSTENDAIEGAWQNIQSPVTKLAQAQAWFSAKEPNNPPSVLREKLGSAIGELDLAEAALRKAAGLADKSPENVELAAATVHRALRGPDQSEAAIASVRVEAQRITYFATTDDSQYRVSVDENAEHFARLSPLALRAIDASWGMWTEDDGIPMPASQAPVGAKLVAGRLDSFGEPSGEGVVLHTLQKDEWVTPSFAIGDDKRTLLFRVDYVTSDRLTSGFRYHLMQSDDAGQRFGVVKLPAGELWASLKASALGNYLSWEASPDSTALHYLQLTPEGPRQQLLSFGGEREGIRNWPPELCQAPNRAWWIVDGAVYTMGNDSKLVPIPSKVVQNPDSFEQIMRCTDDAFSVSSQRYGEEKSSKIHYQQCTLELCSEVVHSLHLPEGARYELVHHRGKWQALVMLDSVVARFTEGAGNEPSQLITIPKARDIHGALSWKAGLLLLAWPEADTYPSLMLMPDSV